MNVDDLLANPAASLPDGAIPTHAIIVIEYANPSDDAEPNVLHIDGDDALMTWQAVGLLTAALDRERIALVSDFLPIDNDADHEDDDA